MSALVQLKSRLLPLERELEAPSCRHHPHQLEGSEGMETGVRLRRRSKADAAWPEMGWK